MKIARKSSKTLGIIAILGLLQTSARAQDPPERIIKPSIRVTGEAVLAVKPDQAQVNIGVVTQASTAQASADQNARQLEATLAVLRQMLGSAADIKTVSYSLSPVYRYPKEGGQPTITGYTATNVVQIKTGDLAQIGKIVDAAAQSGSNTIQALQFKLKDEQAARIQALREAAAKAKAKAEALAAALNLRIIRVLLVDESDASPRPIYAQAEMAGAAGKAPTPVEPGTIDVHASVTLTVEVGQ